MQHYTPTYGARETARHIRDFVRENKQTFWDVLNPLLPFIIGLALFDFIVNIVFFPDADQKERFEMGRMIMTYFYTAMVISWHRVVIHGPDHYKAVNPLKPKRSELAFMGMMIVIMLVGLLIGGLIVLVSFPFGVGAIVIGIFIAIPVAIWFGYKVSFYFPAKAAGADITFKESFAMTKGYIWKLVGAGFLASWRLMLLMVGYLMAVGIIGFAVMSVVLGAGAHPGFVGNLFVFLIGLPIYIFFQPLLTIIGVTALSNYYLYAIQNSPDVGGTGPTARQGL